MNIFINLKSFVNKQEILQAIKIFNVTNNKDVTFYINSEKEDTLTISSNPKIILLNEDIDYGFKNYEKFSIVIDKDNLKKIKDFAFPNCEKDFLNISFILKNNNFRSYLFEYNLSMSLESKINNIENAINLVKNEKKKDNIKISIVEKSNDCDNIIASLKSNEFEINLLKIEDFLSSDDDLILLDDYLMYIIKESFKCLDNYYNKEEKEKKKTNGLTSYFFKNYLPTNKEKNILKYLSKYSFIIKNSTTFINIKYELNANEFRAILMNQCIK